MNTLSIRTAAVKDAPQLLAIYAPYVLSTPITFEIEVPSLEDFQERIRTTLEKYPYLVAVQGEMIVGYAYASAFKSRAAYNWSVETSIYIAQECQGQGIGHQLYTQLESCLKRQHIRNVCACITYPNPLSISFHEAFGYKTVAHFHQSGYKFGTWHDMIWMEKFINDHVDQPSEYIPFSQLSESNLSI